MFTLKYTEVRQMKVCEICGCKFRSAIDYDIPAGKKSYSVCLSCICKAIEQYKMSKTFVDDMKQEDNNPLGAWWA